MLCSFGKQASNLKRECVSTLVLWKKRENIETIIVALPQIVKIVFLSLQHCYERHTNDRHAFENELQRANQKKKKTDGKRPKAKVWHCSFNGL